MTETVAIQEHTSLFDLYDADGCLVGKANPGKKVMLADAFYVPERTCRMDYGLMRNGDTDFHSKRCSSCGKKYDWREVLHSRFCQNCGARVIG